MHLKSPRIVVVGSSNSDLVVQCSQFPKPGETLLGGKFEKFFGGKGANQAVAAARAGGKVTFVGARGADEFGVQASQALKREGIDTRWFHVKQGYHSGVALILIAGASRQNMIVVAESSNSSLTTSDVQTANSVIRQANAVVSQLEIPLAAVQKTANLAWEAKVPFILNAAPVKELPSMLFRKIHTLIVNELEAMFLAKIQDPRKAARKLSGKGCKHVVVTLGAQGALLIHNRTETRIPAPRVKPVDTVGAGDCFTGWLTLGIAEDLPLEEATRRAVVAGALAVTRHGAQAAMPSRNEVLRLLKRQ
jgi:ribokinase